MVTNAASESTQAIWKTAFIARPCACPGSVDNLDPHELDPFSRSRNDRLATEESIVGVANNILRGRDAGRSTSRNTKNSADESFLQLIVQPRTHRPITG